MMRFVISLIIASLLIVSALVLGNHWAWWALPSYWKEIIIVNFFITIIIFVYLQKVQKQQPQIFTQFYLLSIVLKMTGGLSLITFVVWDSPAAAIGNVVVFIVSYLVFTMLEVWSLLKQNPG